MIFCINDFEGPLDLLLHLVKTAKMDIYEIDTKYIIDEYLKFIDTLDKQDIDNASEYLVMAAELIHLKSRLLLNLDDDGTDNSEYTINSEDDLKNKLIEYEKYKNITSVFKELEEKRKEVFTKIPENIKEYKSVKKGVQEEDADLLRKALEDLKKRVAYQKPINTKITKKEINVEDRTNYIRDILSKKKKVNFNDLFREYSKELIVATFLAILEMCKNGEVKLKQNGNFEDILIEKVIT